MNVNGSEGAFVGGTWMDLEECATHFSVSNGSGCPGCAPPPRSRSHKSTPSGTYNVIVIGAGAIGCSIARELSKTNARVLLLDAADDVTQGATKGNSGIVHAGYDDTPGSLKAKYCWAGNQLFPQLDRELHFGYQQNGSLVVAKSEEDLVILAELMERGRKNGIEHLEIIDQAELRRLEPFIHPDAIGALRSPDAGTITPYEYTIALAENAVDNGVELALRREVVAIEQEAKDGAFTLTVQHWELPDFVAAEEAKKARPLQLLLGSVTVAYAVQRWRVNPQPIELLGVVLVVMLAFVLSSTRFRRAAVNYAYSPSAGTVLRGVAGEEKIRCDFIVNAAGCGSDKIAAMVGDTSFTVKRRHGEYVLLHKSEGVKVTHTLFPCPHPVYGKGVLVQGSLWGNLILGPTARDSMRFNSESGKYEVDPDVRDEKASDILSYILSKVSSLLLCYSSSSSYSHNVTHTHARTHNTRAHTHTLSLSRTQT
jgi:L-2-hydroxyglutarate oxidase LhgO